MLLFEELSYAIVGAAMEVPKSSVRDFCPEGSVGIGRAISVLH
ncbi:MAG: hypothetical protein ACRD1R_01970 [Acidobacteriota bacterium]